MERFLRPPDTTKSRQTTPDEHEPKTKRLRRYDESFLQFGFTSVLERNEERPKCLLCSAVLSAESLKPNKLKRHFETVHKEHLGKPLSFFEKKCAELNQQRSYFKKAATVSDGALNASFEVSYLIAKTKTPHTIAETLIMPAVLKMAKAMGEEEVGRKFKAIPLSDNTVKRRIDAIAADQESTLAEKLRDSPAYALQMDVSTEGKNAHALTFVRFLAENAIQEDILYCLPLPEHETAQAMYDVLQDYMEKHRIPWENMVGFCTDGAPSMAGRRNGLRTLVIQRAPSALWNHCMIHREQLASKELSASIAGIMQQVVAMVNYIKPHPLRARLFAKLCVDMGSEYEDLHFHTDARWLSRGNTLERFFKLRNELLAFSMDVKKNDFVDFLCDQQKMCLLAYATDIFRKLNELNTSMQGKNKNVMQMSDRIDGFRAKITHWRGSLAKGNFTHFPQLSQFLEDNSIDKCSTMEMCSHLERLEEHFATYFPDVDMSKFEWVRNPFHCDVSAVDLPATAIEQLIDMSRDKMHQQLHSRVPVEEFWFGAREEYPEIALRALKLLVPFGSTYLCEAGFSALVCMKSKYRSRLDVTSEMRCALSTTEPDFERLQRSVKAQTSH